MPGLNDTLIGEIVDRRFAVLERLAVDVYRVFDLEGLRDLEMVRRADGTLIPSEAVDDAVLDISLHEIEPVGAARATAASRSRPPPLPGAPSATRPRGRLATGRFEAAWFARGEQLAEDEDEGIITDYEAYQARLEKLAGAA